MYQTTLKTTQLGQTDLEITRVGFGAWALGGGDWERGWGPQDDDESIAASSASTGSTPPPATASVTQSRSSDVRYKALGSARTCSPSARCWKDLTAGSCTA
jgi:hypothetical protein